MCVAYQSQNDTKASRGQEASILCVGNLPDLFSVLMVPGCASRESLTNLAENIGRKLRSFEEFHGDVAGHSSKSIRIRFFQKLRVGSLLFGGQIEVRMTWERQR